MRTENPTVPRVDRSAFSVTTGFDDSEEKAYWHAQTPQVRIAHMEFLRRINYGPRAAARLQRLLEVVE